MFKDLLKNMKNYSEYERNIFINMKKTYKIIFGNKSITSV